jgi:hypothetical protein
VRIPLEANARQILRLRISRRVYRNYDEATRDSDSILYLAHNDRNLDSIIDHEPDLAERNADFSVLEEEKLPLE